MKLITKVVCSYDGSEHNSIQEAQKHLDKAYGLLLGKLSRELTELARIPKVGLTHVETFIDENLNSRFAELRNIHKDLILHKEDEE